MQKTRPFFFALALSLAAPFAAVTSLLAGDPEVAMEAAQVDKSSYDLFHPTPRALWRELAPDRPDTTESPVTVDAGVWVVEASYFDWRRDRGNETSTVMATNLKVGLDQRTDLQFVFDAYSREHRIAGAGAGAEGFGDLTLRIKRNLWGNEGGGSAFALFPWVAIPTGTERSRAEVEGGLILPFSTELAEGVGLGLMAGIDAVHDESDDRYDAELVHSAVLGFDLTDRLGMFTEYVGVAGPGPYQAYLLGGFTLGLGENLLLDWGAQAGLNDAAGDIGLFGGFTRRF